MRCQACNKRLNDIESSKKHPTTKEYTDLCTSCYNAVVGQLMYGNDEATNLYKEESLSTLLDIE